MPQKGLPIMAFQCDEDMRYNVRVQAAKEGKTIREFLTDAVDKALDESYRREFASKNAGTGSHRAVRAIQKLTSAQKAKMTVDADAFEKEFYSKNS